ncbi:ankyrin [Zopfia rhizophila CBS 207.26]|uniref:Ankyrin n=1 Tax=Zopfia rhizophila CBS 207.26 TaxID=1314779 RepID=A0A6A6D6D1_9PEZI|nr:ankyrin [Zopfia rhizophila CBS 207.26]
MQTQSGCISPNTAIQMLRSAINGLNLDQFLPMLPVLDQEKHISTIPHLDRDDPTFYWVFRNKDFSQWNSAESFQVLWLSGPPECKIHQVSSYIVGPEKNTALKTDHLVLYFFSSSATSAKQIVAAFVHTLLSQIVCCSPTDRRLLIIQSFLHSLLDEAFEKEAAPNWEKLGFNEGDSPDKNLQKLLKAPANEHLAALGAVLNEEQRGLSVVINRLDKVVHQRGESIKGVHAFVEHLQQRTSKVKILLTSRPSAEIKDPFDGLLCIEHDRERKGKPGSGKSTLTKYFGDHLLKREPAAKSSIVAKFFYSFREDQDEAFFYHRFQTEYRNQRRREPRVAWHYKSLKTVLKSLQDYPLARRLYLVIDAVDEFEENDRRDVLKLLFELCSKIKYCIAKVFVASWPVGELDLCISQSHHNFIRLQDETKRDISTFARSFLDGLNLTHVLAQATEYIVENAQGVFLWVKLVGEELETYAAEGYAEEQIFEFLQRLPMELKDFYTLMFKKMNWDKRYPTDAVKIFLFVLFGRRPFTVDELLHALGIPDYPDTEFTSSDDSFRKRIPSQRRIISCGGNFLEIKPHYSTGKTCPDSRNPQANKAAGKGTVQVIHQSVREFFLDPKRGVAISGFRICEKDAHICISITCIRYLMLCAKNSTLAETLPDVEFWTSEHFERYAQYLDKRPLANYALRYLTHHIDGCHRDANVLDITYQFIDQLAHNPAVYLLENWVSSCPDKVIQGRELIQGREQGLAARKFRNRVLHTAVRNGFSTAAETLLTVGTNVNARGNDGWTALQAAAGGGHVEVVDKLLAANANVNSVAAPYDGRTALQAAAGGGHIEVVDKLLAANADVNAAAEDRGRTALQAAAGGGHVEVVDKMLAANADVNADVNGRPGWDGGRTAPQAAAGGGHVEVVDKLLAANADVNAAAVRSGSRTALQAAEGGGHVKVVDKLKRAGAVY